MAFSHRALSEQYSAERVLALEPSHIFIKEGCVGAHRCRIPLATQLPMDLSDFIFLILERVLPVLSSLHPL